MILIVPFVKDDSLKIRPSNLPCDLHCNDKRVERLYFWQKPNETKTFIWIRTFIFFRFAPLAFIFPLIFLAQKDA